MGRHARVTRAWAWAALALMLAATLLLLRICCFPAADRDPVEIGAGHIRPSLDRLRGDPRLGRGCSASLAGARPCPGLRLYRASRLRPAGLHWAWFELVFWLMLVTWATDIFAYFAGRSIGGPSSRRGSARTRPGPGLIGGMAGAAVVGALAASCFEIGARRSSGSAAPMGADRPGSATSTKAGSSAAPGSRTAARCCPAMAGCSTGSTGCCRSALATLPADGRALDRVTAAAHRHHPRRHRLGRPLDARPRRAQPRALRRARADRASPRRRPRRGWPASSAPGRRWSPTRALLAAREALAGSGIEAAAGAAGAARGGRLGRRLDDGGDRRLRRPRADDGGDRAGRHRRAGQQGSAGLGRRGDDRGGRSAAARRCCRSIPSITRSSSASTGPQPERVRRITLTASGGPFRDWSLERDARGRPRRRRSPIPTGRWAPRSRSIPRR